MKEYLVIDNTGCVNFFSCNSRQELYIKMFEAQLKAVVIREMHTQN